MTSQKGEGSLTGRARASISVLWERQGHTTTLNASRTSRREREVGRAKVALTLFTVLKFSACPLPFLGCTPQPNWAQVGPPHKRQIGIPPVSRPRRVSAPQGSSELPPTEGGGHQRAGLSGCQRQLHARMPVPAARTPLPKPGDRGEQLEPIPASGPCAKRLPTRLRLGNTRGTFNTYQCLGPPLTPTESGSEMREAPEWV